MAFFIALLLFLCGFASCDPRKLNYDARSYGHHDVIRAAVETIQADPCPADNPFFMSGPNLTFNLVCGRKTKTPVVGACLWQLPSERQDGDARFEEKKRKQVERNETLKCGCGVEYGFLDQFTCSGLRIEGPQESIIILATSLTKLAVDVGSKAHFWIDYLLADPEPEEESGDGHSVFISHWYNNLFARSNFHLVHSFHKPSSTDRIPSEDGSGGGQEKPIYRAHMHIQSATVDESGLYTFEINHNTLAATIAFFLNVRTNTTQLNFYVRKPPNGKRDYDPFGRINPTRFLEAKAEYEIICAATIGDYDSGNEGLILSLYRTPCVKDQFGKTVCNADANVKLPLIELTQESVPRLDSANGRDFTYKREGRHVVITYKVQAMEAGIYDCAIASSQGHTLGETADSLRFIPVDIPNAVDKSGMEVIVRTDTIAKDGLGAPEQTKSTGYLFLDNDTIIFECRYQYLDYRFERWQFIGDNGHAQTIIRNTTRFTLEQEDGPLSYSAGVTRLIIHKADADRDSGKYICTLSDQLFGGKQANIQTYILVQRPIAPKFQDDSSLITIDVNETESLTLSCLLQPDVLPWPQITWFKDGHPLSGLLTYTDHMQVVQFRRMVREDFGNYSCLVKNRGGMIRRMFQVDVLTENPSLDRSLITDDRSKKSLVAVLCVLSVFVAVLLAVLASMWLKSYRRKKRLTELHHQLINSTKENVAPLDPNVPINQQPDNLPYDAQYEISKDRLILGAILGEGQFGKVLDGYVFSDDGERSVHVAVKVPKDGMDITQQRMLLSEFKIMSFVGNHVNVLGLVAAITHRMPKGELYVISDYCEYGSLRTYLIQRRPDFDNELLHPFEKNGYILSNEFARRSRSNAGLSTAINDTSLQNQTDATSQRKRVRTTDLLSFAYQVANGMEYLASKNVVHRDLALRNVLLTKDYIIKIGDFGLALHEDRSKDARTNNVPLPAKWMALESILFGEYSVKSDIWSFGVVLWEIFSLADSPYPDKAPSSALGDWLAAGNRLAPPKYAPEEIYHLMTQCWRALPQERPTFIECRDHIGIDMHLRSQEDFESLQNLLNSFHAYVNVQGSVISDENSPSTALLSFSKSIFDQTGLESGTVSPMAMEAENLVYNLSEPPHTVVAVENLNYSPVDNQKMAEWV